MDKLTEIISLVQVAQEDDLFWNGVYDFIEREHFMYPSDNLLDIVVRYATKMMEGDVEED